MLANKTIPISGSESPTTEYGTIESLNIESGLFTVQAQSGSFIARTAFSCLVSPETNDKVLISHTSSHECFILAITERPDNKNTTLEFHGDVNIKSSHGKVRISAQEGLQLTTEQSLSMSSGNLDVLAEKALLSINESTLTGNKLSSHVSRVQVFARSIDTIADRLSQTVKNSFRLIKGVDQTKAGDVLTTIGNLLSIRSRQAVIVAKSDIKIDAERIHMG